MLDLSCLDRAPALPGSELLSGGLFSTLFVLILLGLIGAATASLLVQRAYRRRVVRLMRFEQVSERPSQWWQSQARRMGQDLEQSKENSQSAGEAKDLIGLVQRREHRIAVSTAVAWLVFVLAALPVGRLLLAGNPASDQALFALGAGLLALGPVYVNLPRRFALRALLAGLAACALGVALIAGLSGADALSPAPSNEPDDPGFLATTVGVLVVGLSYMTLFHRTLRGVVLPVFAVATTAALLFLLPIGLLEPHLGDCIAEATTPGHPALQAPFVAAGTTLVMLSLWLGFKALDGLTRLIEAGWLSELSMLGAVSLLLIALAMAAGALFDRSAPPAWLAWLPLPWVAASFAAYALALGHRENSPFRPRLLVLRVFASERAKIRLLDQLQSRWRYVGPVHQIGGPDLATMNVDPYECSLFLVGRLHDAFLPTAANSTQLSSRLHGAPDREGRYRISEVFCFNSAWRPTVEQLMRTSEAILIDLRGFGSGREGTGYELRVLARAGLLDRAVAIGDERTDWAYVEQLLREEGQDPRRLDRRAFGQKGSVDEVFERLLDVAARAKAAGSGASVAKS